jgi:hypothetical protein
MKKPRDFLVRRGTAPREKKRRWHFFLFRLFKEEEGPILFFRVQQQLKRMKKKKKLFFFEYNQPTNIPKTEEEDAGRQHAITPTERYAFSLWHDMQERQTLYIVVE